jgi:hypothetical protein
MATQQKFRYAVDPLNRLVITTPHSPQSPLKRVRTVEGTFRMGRENTLEWRARSREDSPFHKITFKGHWNLTSDHRLQLTLDKSHTQVFGDTLVFKGLLGEPKASNLTFTLRGGRTPSGKGKRTLRLKGVWQADRQNRLTFLSERVKEQREHRITLSGAWEVGKNNILIYRYTQKALKKQTHEIRFSGVWHILESRAIEYRLEGKGPSRFLFRVALRTPTLRAHQNKIPFRVGIQLKKTKTLSRNITLLGTWKLRRKLELSFEMDYGNGKIRHIHFATTFYVNKKNQLTMRLNNKKGEPLNMEVVFTRKFWEDSEFFLRLRHGKPRTALEGGLRIPF